MFLRRRNAPSACSGDSRSKVADTLLVIQMMEEIMKRLSKLVSYSFLCTMIVISLTGCSTLSKGLGVIFASKTPTSTNTPTSTSTPTITPTATSTPLPPITIYSCAVTENCTEAESWMNSWVLHPIRMLRLMSMFPLTRW